MRKQNKKILAIMLVFAFSFSPLSFSNIFSFSRADMVEEISGYTEWNQSRTVDKNVIIKPEATLVIGKGVKINFTQLVTSVDVQGSLFINGSTEEPAILRCDVDDGGFYITTEENSKVSIRNAEIIKGGFEAYLVKKSINTALAENYNAAIQVNGGDVNIQNTTFKNNLYAVIVSNPDAKTHVNYSRFIDNNFDVSAGAGADFKYNWWGFPDGPQQTCYTYGNNQQHCHYQKIYGDFDFSDWMTEENFKLGASNVLFLPGLEASRLYAGEDQLWEPNADSDAEDLFLDSDGKSVRNDIYTKDVIDEVNILPIGQKNIYESFEDDLDKWKNDDKIINDYAIAPYDWRLPLEDILNRGIKTGENISYNESTENPYIIQELKRLADNSRTGKVTIIAHSNGGLLAKVLVNKLGSEAASLIDKIVFVAVPQSGTPQAIGGLLHGYDQGIPYDWFYPFLSPETARQLAENMPSAYHLLPSEAYFNGEGSEVNTPVISFKDGTLTQSFIDKYGYEIKDFGKLQDFLSDDKNKVSADNSDTESPSKLNRDLINYGKNIHEAIDDGWEIPASISVYQIAGFGEKTLKTIKYWTGAECVLPANGYCLKYQDKLQYTPEMAIDGDGTVAAPSALAMSDDDENVKRFWVDLFDYNDKEFDREHADILEVLELRNFIKDNILTQTSSSFPNYLSDSIPSINTEKHLHYILHSPLMLSAYDITGNEISASVSTISGAEYKRFGEVQYVSVPASVAHTLKLDGLSEGSFTLEMQEAEGDNILATVVFAGIPSFDKTKVTMNVADGTIQNASPLKIDYDGDNSVDFYLEPKAGETVYLPLPDQIPPEAKIFFNTETKSIIVEGIDENPTTVSYSEIPASQKNQKQKDKTTAAVITDQAGNTTVLTYTEKFPNRERRVAIELKSVSYNGVAADFNNTTLKYKWNNHKNDGAYKMFASHIHTASKILESHYRPKKDITIIMVEPQDLDDNDEDDDCDRRPVREKISGMVVPGIETNQGVVNVNY